MSPPPPQFEWIQKTVRESCSRARVLRPSFTLGASLQHLHPSPESRVFPNVSPSTAGSWRFLRPAHITSKDTDSQRLSHVLRATQWNGRRGLGPALHCLPLIFWMPPLAPPPSWNRWYLRDIGHQCTGHFLYSYSLQGLQAFFLPNILTHLCIFVILLAFKKILNYGTKVFSRLQIPLLPLPLAPACCPRDLCVGVCPPHSG